MRILGMGHCTLEYLGVVERHAALDQRQELEQFSVQGGGSVATALVALARWGAQAAFIGKVGDDARGDAIIATLEAEGVDASAMVRESGAVSQCDFSFLGMASGLTRAYYTLGNVSALRVDEVALDALEGCDALLVDGSAIEAQAHALHHARARGVRTLLHAARPSEGIGRLVALSELVVCSERFASQLTGQGALRHMCEALLACGPSTVVVTLGDEGCVVMTSSVAHLSRVGPCPVEVFDRAGAGDVFYAALLFATLNAKPLLEAARFANAAAALSCEGLGGRSSIPALARLDAMLASAW